MTVCNFYLFTFCYSPSGAVSGTPQVPTFSWLHDQASPDGVPLLSVNFHDGKPDDVAVLKHVNPIPKPPKELEKNIDKCIFGGFLRMESNVYVTLTGGCPFEDHFEVQNYRTYRMTNYVIGMVVYKRWWYI